MFGADEVVVEAVGFFTRERQHLLGAGCKSANVFNTKRVKARPVRRSRSFPK